MTSSLSRRTLLQATAVGAGAASLGGRAFAAPPADPKFLIVLCASGGASLVDSFLAVRESESANAAKVNAYPDKLVQSIEGTDFTAIDLTARSIGALPAPFSANQSNFVKKHGKDMMVVTMTGTSVNHGIAEYRSINGNAAYKGRTLQEAVATQYGVGHVIPNVHLINGVSFTDRGTDETIPKYALGERVPAPNLWPLSLDGYKGIKGAPPRDLFEAARTFRNTTLDPKSEFARTFATSARIDEWERLRGEPLKGIEGADLISKLMFYPDSAEMPLSQFGLKASQLGEKVTNAFPAYKTDPLEAQAAMAFLLLRYGIAVTVTLGPDLNGLLKNGVTLEGDGNGLSAGGLINTPVGFDFSHNAVRETQAMMWNRTLSVADRLITLLKSEEYAKGESYWDRSMIYCATEFGRTRNRPDNAMTFGAGHDLNNGFLIISPLVNGGKVMGGVDKATTLTYGFDPLTGRPDPGRTMTEAHVYAGIVQALGVETPGGVLPDMRSMRKTA
jgi:hypothetical protein